MKKFLALLAIFAITGPGFGPSQVWADITTGLVAYYPFNGNANDESGNGNHGTVNGATLTTDRNGKANSAYELSGNSGSYGSGKYIDIPDSINGLTNVTLSVWVNERDQSIESIG